MTVLIATSENDFDPTEVAVPWQILRNAGKDVVFATETGKTGHADQRMLDGNGFGVLKPLLIAQKAAQESYFRMLESAEFQNPIPYGKIHVEDYEGLILPGGHAKRIIPYLESERLQQAIVQFFAANKPVGAICHGVIAACRSVDSATGKSVLFGRKTTCLLKTQELLAYKLTRAKLGDYYLTYPTPVEDEVVATLRSVGDFSRGPLPVLRDSEHNVSRGFTVRDGNYLSARWPGDVHRFSMEFLEMLSA